MTDHAKTEQEFIEAISEDINHLARGCRSARSHEPYPYVKRIADNVTALLAGHAAEVERLRQDVAQCRASLRQFESSSALALREARAEVEQLRQEHSALTRELATMLGPITPHHGLSHAALWVEKVGGVLIERDEARADAETLRQENERLRRRLGEHCTCDPDCEIQCDDCAALAAAQEPPAAPCYVCGHPVAEGEGRRRDSKTWCPDHRPVWSHD